MATNHHYPDFFLNMKVYLCSSKSNVLLLSEHLSYHWLSVNKLKNLDWAAADIPVVKKLLSNNYSRFTKYTPHKIIIKPTI